MCLQIPNKFCFKNQRLEVNLLFQQFPLLHLFCISGKLEKPSNTLLMVQKSGPPVDVVDIPVFIGFYTSQVVQDFFHKTHHRPIEPCCFGGNGPIHWRTTCAQGYAGVIFCGRVPTRASAEGLLSRKAFANARSCFQPS